MKESYYGETGSFRYFPSNIISLNTPSIGSLKQVMSEKIPLLTSSDQESYQSYSYLQDGSKDLPQNSSARASTDIIFEKEEAVCCRCFSKFKNILEPFVSYPWCPSWLDASQVIYVTIIILIFWGVAYSQVEEDAAPGGQLFNIAATALIAQLAGWVISFLHLPPLLGMLLAGIVLRNVGFIHIQGSYTHLAAVLRQIALVIILIRAGLGLDPVALKRLSWIVVRLAMVPSIVEIISIAIFSHLLLGLPWMWGFLLGSILAAVSPAVVIPCLFSLQSRGYGVEKGIPTLIVAAASFDDIIAISVFGILISVIFSTGNLTTQVIKGPVGLIMGLACGVLWGLILHYVPAKHDPWVVGVRTILVGGGGLLFVFASEVIGYDGAGPLACIVAAFVACYGWRKDGWGDHNPVSENFALFWSVFQPILFCLIGTEINIFVLEIHTVGLGVACLFIALTFKMLLSMVAAMGADMNLKELIFVSTAWFPKATVQAALGPVALDIARKTQADKEVLAFADHVLIVAVLSILITAPLGAVIITLLGPRLLTKAPDSEEPQSNLSGHC